MTQIFQIVKKNNSKLQYFNDNLQYVAMNIKGPDFIIFIYGVYPNLLKFYQNDHHTKKPSYQISHSILPKNAIEKKTPQFIKGKPWLNWGGNKFHKNSHNTNQSKWEWPTTKCHSKIVVFDQLCSRLGVIHHLDEEKIAKEYEQLKQNRSHLIFNIQIVMGSNPKILG